jgi:precorrin-3B methylase
MSWTSRISGCFGVADKKFALHASDTLRAAEMLKAASEENVGWDEYVNEIKSWLKSQGCEKNHIEEQMERVKDIRNYLIYD